MTSRFTASWEAMRTAMREQHEAAAAAQARGEAESAAWSAHAQAMQRTIGGSGTDTSDADRGADDGAVFDWPRGG